MAPIVGYWDVRGRGEPIRLTLKFAGVNFEDKRYKFDLKTKKNDWTDVKPTLGLDFPNLPYFIDGDLKLTQSLAILRYLGRKYNLAGSNETEYNRVALIEQQVTDLGSALGKMVWRETPATEEEKAEFRKSLVPQLEALNKFLGATKFVAGPNPTYVDFLLYEYLHSLKSLHEKEGGSQSGDAKFDHLKQFSQSVEALPQVTAYLKEINSKK